MRQIEEDAVGSSDIAFGGFLYLEDTYEGDDYNLDYCATIVMPAPCRGSYDTPPYDFMGDMEIRIETYEAYDENRDILRTDFDKYLTKVKGQTYSLL